MSDRISPWLDGKLAVCAALSVAAHLGLVLALEWLPDLAANPRSAKVEIRVVEAAPPPPAPATAAEPVSAPLPKAPNPPRPRTERASHPPATHSARPPKPVPPPATDTSDTPAFGVNMASTSTVGATPATTVGTAEKPASGADASAKSLGVAAVAAYEATKMPLPQGRCFGAYTEEARAAGVEGTVVLDLVVGDDGVPRDVTVTAGLDHGLSEAAVAAVRGCRFSPGEKDGEKVAVRIRGFKIRYVLSESQ